MGDRGRSLQWAAQSLKETVRNRRGPPEFLSQNHKEVCMKTLRKILGIAILSLVAGWAGAQPVPGPGPEIGVARLKQIGLSDAQAKQVAELVAKERSDAAPQLAELKVLRAQIHQAMTAATPDLDAVNALVDKEMPLRAQMEKRFLAVEAQVHQIVGDPLYYELKRQFLAHRRGEGPRWGGAWGR